MTRLVITALFLVFPALPASAQTYSKNQSRPNLEKEIKSDKFSALVLCKPGAKYKSCQDDEVQRVLKDTKEKARIIPSGRPAILPPKS